MKTLPNKAGFYWWRRETEPFRMVHVIDVLGGPSPVDNSCKLGLRAWDVEFQTFKGRALSDWPASEIGEWCTVIRPEDMAGFLSGLFSLHDMAELDPFQTAIRDCVMGYIEDGARACCHTSRDGITDSGGISDRACMLRELAAGNRFRILRQYGRMVVGHWPENDPLRKIPVPTEAPPERPPHCEDCAPEFDCFIDASRCRKRPL